GTLLSYPLPGFCLGEVTRHGGPLCPMIFPNSRGRWCRPRDVVPWRAAPPDLGAWRDSAMRLPRRMTHGGRPSARGEPWPARGDGRSGASRRPPDRSRTSRFSIGSLLSALRG